MSPRNALSIFVLAASVRALALWADTSSLLYQVGGLDAPQYLDMARRFVTGEWPDDKPFFWAPGYSVFLGLLATLSESITWLKAAQVALGAASCVLVGALASRLFENARVAVIAAITAALYGPLVYYDLQISPASLDVFLSVLLLVFLLEARRRDRWWLWLGAGVVAAGSAVTRGAVLPMLPFAVAWVLWPPPRLGLRHAAQLAALLVPAGLVLALVAQHNLEGDRSWGGKPAKPPSQAHEPTGGLLLSYNLGINFLLGNVPEHHAVNRVEHPLCLLNYKMLVVKPTLASAYKPSAQSSFLFDEALAWMRAHPVEWLQLTGAKVLELIDGEEISRDTSIEASGVDNPVLDALFWKHGLAFPSGLVIPLALLGIAYAPKRSRAHALVLGALATQVIFVIAFFVTTRYRLALVTVAIPYTAYVVVAAYERLRTGARPSAPALLLAALLGVLAFTAGNYSTSPEPREHAAFEHDHLGAQLEKQGKLAEAVQHWQTALALDPSYAQAHFQLANYQAKRGDVGAAIVHYERGIAAAPSAFAARIAYADLLIRKARAGEAAVQLRRALRDGPSWRVHMTVCNMARKAKLDLTPDCK